MRKSYLPNVYFKINSLGIENIDKTKTNIVT